MASWRDDYKAALHERDIEERSKYRRLDPELIDSFTKLLDKTAALEAEKAAILSTPAGTPRDSFKTTPIPVEGNAQLRADLAEALRSNGQLRSRLKNAEAELLKTKMQNKSDSKLIKDLTAQRAVLSQKVRDRDEEIKGKGKMLDDVQDEMISLNLQLNIAEQRSHKLQAENKELIDRWMARMGKEADEMNKAFQEQSLR